MDALLSVACVVGASSALSGNNLDVIKTAGWIVDLGSEAGDAGGHIVAQGTPEEVESPGELHRTVFEASALGHPIQLRKKKEET